MDSVEVLQLLGIVLQSKDYPGLRPIHNEAMRQLDSIAADLAPKPTVILEPKVEEEPKPRMGRYS